MAKFVYRMQSILDIKLKMEEQARQAFAAAKIKADEEQAKLEQLQERKGGYEQQVRELLLQKLDFQKIEESYNAMERMDEFIALQKERVKRAEEQLEETQEVLAQVRMERKAQEILKEKAFDEFKQELNRAESKEVDELTSYTHGKRAAAH